MFSKYTARILRSSVVLGSKLILLPWIFKYFVPQGGSLHGKFVDATPFSDAVKGANRKTETDSDSLVDELGSMLRARGFNYHGVEVLYSGVYGTELKWEIFIGLFIISD